MKINIENYESWLIDRMEGQLSPEQLIELEGFLEAHPTLKEEAALLEMTRLEPDLSVVFEGKEALKKEAGGKVLFLSSTIKWASAVAAILVLFIGIRFAIGNKTTEPNAELYSKEDTSIHLPVKASDQDKSKNLDAELVDGTQHFANNTPKKSEQQKADPSDNLLPEEFFADASLNNIPLKNLDQLPSKELTPHLKVSDFDDLYALMYNYNYENMMKGVQQNPETIVDKWNDAVAVVNDMSSVLGFGRKPQTDSSNHDNYKTTTIRILGFEYYNRKRINN